MSQRIVCFGIDVHLDELVVRVADQASGEEVGPPLRVPNNRVGAQQVVTWLQQTATREGMGPAQLLGGLEATGLLWIPVYTFLTEQPVLQALGLQLHVFNPKLIADWKKGVTLAEDKDDDHDAGGIVSRLRFGALPKSYVPSAFWQGLRRLTRYRFHLAQELTREENRFVNHAYLKVSDWRRVQAFSEVLGATSATLLTQYSVSALAAFSTEQLAALIDRLGKHAFTDSLDVARKVQRALSQSYPVDPRLEPAVTEALKAQLDHIRDLHKRIERLDKVITQQMEGVPNPLRSVKGLGPVLSAGLLAEIVDIHRFEDEADLARYAGLFWIKRASAHFQAEDQCLAKVGNPYLRYYLLLGADELRRYNLEYQAYYRRKYEESTKHHHKRALVLTGRKLVRLVHALLTKNQVFVARPAAGEHTEARGLSRAA